MTSCCSGFVFSGDPISYQIRILNFHLGIYSTIGTNLIHKIKLLQLVSYLCANPAARQICLDFVVYRHEPGQLSM